MKLRFHRTAGIPAILGAATVLLASSTAPAQHTERTVLAGRTHTGHDAGSLDDVNCRECHYCARPTAINKCLVRPCPRNRTKDSDPSQGNWQGPDVVILDELADVYLPVPFDHKGHASMAEMTGGCSTCHHFSPDSERPPTCKTCHDVFSAGTDIYKPGLKGAYHQQCMNCHRDWVDETDCGICHVRKADGSTADRRNAIATRDDMMGRAHPPILEPAGDFYTGTIVPSSGAHVLFRHNRHVNRFGLTCVECHHEPSCTRCHGGASSSRSSQSPYEHHKPCLRCHKADMDGASEEARCDRCHWKEGEPIPELFAHEHTGWPLGKYHQDASCRSCHVAAPFRELERDCRVCHADWSPATFDHRITGQVLDEDHREHDCNDCHLEGRFDLPPTCTECHDAEDEGIAFPAQRPGPVTQPD
jgi:hypothetical protein